MPDITINGITVDLQGAPSAGFTVATAPITFSDTSSTNYILVQTRSPLPKSEKAQLEATGARLIEHVPENTYIARYDPPDLTPVLNLPFVHWAGPYLPGFKVPAALTPDHSNRLSLATAAALQSFGFSDATRDVDVVFHRDVDTIPAARDVATAAGLHPEDVKPSGGKVRIRVAINRIASLVALDEVRHIEEVFPMKLHNDVARQLLRLETANPGPLQFEGEGQLITVCDTGFDTGSSVNTHPAFTNRVRKLYPLGGRISTNDPNGHGTHVAGSALGDGTSAQLGRVCGTAPRAELVMQSVLDANGNLSIPPNLDALFSIPYSTDGARIHSNSWGSILGDGRYDTNCFELDDFVWNHRDMIICFAAGNEGRDADADGMVDPMSITPPATAKNCITIGASENYRPSRAETYGLGWPRSFPANPIASDIMANNPDGMAAFSSRGPTKDKRFKPDVVAPGTFILSAKSRAASGNGWAASSDPLYCFMGGTSMATPLIAGCAALVREFLGKKQKNPIANPTAALVKAMLINGAVDVPGQYLPSEAGAIPNSSEGFGRVDMSATVGARAAEVVLLEDEGTSLDQGDEITFNVAVPNGAANLKATLVWTDIAGESLQNDLDLIVRAGSDEWHGNMPAGSAAFDRINNVEQILWSGVSAGIATITVRAYRITKATQPFGLVVRIF